MKGQRKGLETCHSRPECNSQGGGGRKNWGVAKQKEKRDLGWHLRKNSVFSADIYKGLLQHCLAFPGPCQLPSSVQSISKSVALSPHQRTFFQQAQLMKDSRAARE